MEEQSFNWQNEALAFLALSSIRGVGYWTMRAVATSNVGFWNLLKSGTPENFEDALSVRFSCASGADWEQFKTGLWSTAVETAKSLAADGIGLIFFGQEEFPARLREIPDPPYWLFVQGELANLHASSVTVVGSRKPSEDGLFMTRYLITALAGQGMPTISGLALGIDQAVHLESIRYRIPTVAVLGTGITENYPKNSGVLRQAIILQGGTVISEYLLNQTYSADNFVRRNRIQAALCDTLIPVEWQIKSGTAHTVDFAYRYGRKILNLFLPDTLSSRPEIAFAQSQYSAVACQVPHMTDLMLRFIHEDADKPKQGQFSLDI